MISFDDLYQLLAELGTVPEDELEAAKEKGEKEELELLVEKYG